MRLIYHIVSAAAWDPGQTEPYRAESFATEGFIHCSNADQVARVANLYYWNEPDLIVLCIDAARLTSPLRDEDGGAGERFPHVYGPIPREAIVEVRRLERAPGRQWVFPGHS